MRGPLSPAEQYPVIRVLSHDDALFVQQQAELDEFRQRHGGAGPASRVSCPSLDIFAYTPRQTEDLFSLNARLGLRYDTLATLNGTPSKDSLRRPQARSSFPARTAFS